MAKVKKSILYEFDIKKQREFDREEGREEGKETLLVDLIQKKVQKGKTIDQIADELEMTTDEIRPFYEECIKSPE